MSTGYPAIGGPVGRADVVVVGAGLAGLATAWHLSSHRKVVVLDRAGAGTEASGQGVGMVRRMGEDPFERTLAIRTAAWLAAPGEDWPRPPARAVGAAIGLANDPTTLNDTVAHLVARGVRVEEVDRVEQVAPVLRGSPLRRLWWLPDEWLADPRALLDGFLGGTLRQGGEVRSGVSVEGLLTDGDRVIGVRTDAGPVHADAVVLAAGAWCAGLAAGIGLRRPLFPLRRTVIRAASAPPPDSPWAWIDDVGIYARPHGAEWWVSACDEAVAFPADRAGSRAPATDAVVALARDKLARWIPSLAGAPLADGWSGLRTFAPDRRPVLGADPERPGLWWAAGLGGYGVTCAYAAGEAVATWLRGETTPWLNASAVSPGRAHLGRWPIRPDGDLARSVLIDGRLPDPFPVD